MSRRITIRVIPNARKNSVEPYGEGLKVRVTARATDGKANEALIRELAAYFGLKRQAITILKGATARNKIIEISD